MTVLIELVTGGKQRLFNDEPLMAVLRAISTLFLKLSFCCLFDTILLVTV